MLVRDRSASRRFFAEVWEKYRHGYVLEPLEDLIAGVIRQHPEYHGLLEDLRDVIEADFGPEGGETNPFLHLGMHVALEEQIRADRPVGIAALYARYLRSAGDPHLALHRMMECLAEALWRAERERRLPDENAYLECLRRM